MTSPTKARVEPPGLSPVEYGKRGAVRRWGPPRRVNLAELDPPYRRLVLAMIDAAKAANVAERSGQE
jgi:hypothetical protein